MKFSNIVLITALIILFSFIIYNKIKNIRQNHFNSNYLDGSSCLKIVMFPKDESPEGIFKARMEVIKMMVSMGDIEWDKISKCFLLSDFATDSNITLEEIEDYIAYDKLLKNQTDELTFTKERKIITDYLENKRSLKAL